MEPIPLPSFRALAAAVADVTQNEDFHKDRPGKMSERCIQLDDDGFAAVGSSGVAVSNLAAEDIVVGIRSSYWPGVGN